MITRKVKVSRVMISEIRESNRSVRQLNVTNFDTVTGEAQNVK